MSAPKRARDEPAGAAAAGGAGGPPPPPPPPARRLPPAEADDTYERRLKLTDVIGFVALNGYAREADACAGLNRETWRCIPAGRLSAADANRVRRDHPLWQAIIDLGHGKRKQTRLTLAVQHGSLARVRELCDWRAQVDAVDSGGWTPLYWATSIKCTTDVVRELLDRGANIEATTLSGWTSLHVASLDGRLDVVSDLLAHGADPNTATIYGPTPLITSSRYGHVEIVRALLDAGADKHRVANNGETAASIAGTGMFAAPASRAAILALFALRRER
jgi:hypothetical protein